MDKKLDYKSIKGSTQGYILAGTRSRRLKGEKWREQVEEFMRPCRTKTFFFLSFIMFCLFVSIEEESQHGVKCSGW